MNEEKLKKLRILKNKLDKKLGGDDSKKTEKEINSTLKIIYENEELKGIKKDMVSNNESLNNFIKELKESLDNKELEYRQIERLNKIIGKLDEQLNKEINIPKYPSEIKAKIDWDKMPPYPNQKEIKIPEYPLEKVTNFFTKIFEGIKKSILDVRIVNRYLPVRFMKKNKDGSLEEVDPQFNIEVTSGGGASFITSDGRSMPARIDSSGHLQVDILSGAEQASNMQTEI